MISLLAATELGLNSILQFPQEVGNALCMLLECSQLLHLLKTNVYLSSVIVVILIFLSVQLVRHVPGQMNIHVSGIDIQCHLNCIVAT